SAERETLMSQAVTLDSTATAAAACLGALLRRLRNFNGLTQAGLGRRTGYHGSYIGAVERSAVRPSRELVERCDEALQADGVLLMVWSLVDLEGTLTATDGDEPALEVAAPDARPGPDGAVFEAVEVARRAEASELGPGTLAGVERTVARLRDAAAGTPPGELIPAVLAQLGYVGRLLERRPTLAQHRRLLVAAGWLSVVVAQLSFEAGDREAAEASRDAAFRLARQAGHAELAAWSVEALALWALADGRLTDALELAQSGQDLAPPASAAAVQLALDEAQAWSSLGDQGRAAGARHQAALTRAMLPTATW
ncbi:MAG TPA: helix-turn-helix transcriptional regulator, partial [Actinomycetota bacterium]